MRQFILPIFAILLLALTATAQNSTSTQTASAATTETKKRPPVFRATKDQIQQAQAKLKEKGMYAGEANGSLDDATRAGLKKFQETEKIRATGGLNRITLERMNIQLTENQMKIPVTESSMTPDETNASEKSSSSASTRFRATKEQIMQAQKMLADKNLYAGEQKGKMTDDFRAALRKYQETEKIKATGTLSRETVEKMGVPLTDKQKAMPAGTQPK